MLKTLKVNISEINSDQGQIDKIIWNISENELATNEFILGVFEIFLCGDSSAKADVTCLVA